MNPSNQTVQERVAMSEKTNLRKIPILGVILIAIGLLLLMDQIGMMDLTFWNIITGFMILYGAVLVIRSFTAGDRSKVFWGTVLFLLGLYLMLDSMGLITPRYPVFIPAVFLIIGFSFLMMYIYNLRDWHLLIPTLFFIAIGFLIIGDELSLFQAWRFEYYLLNFWPVLLILFGLGLIAKSRRRRRCVDAEPVIEKTAEGTQ